MTNIQSRPKNTQERTKHLFHSFAARVVLLIFIITVGLLIVYLALKTQKPETCDTTLQSAKQLSAQKKYQEAYEKLNSKAQACTKASGDKIRQPNQIKEYTNVILYSGNLAIAAYDAGHILSLIHI